MADKVSNQTPDFNALVFLQERPRIGIQGPEKATPVSHIYYNYLSSSEDPAQPGTIFEDVYLEYLPYKAGELSTQSDHEYFYLKLTHSSARDSSYLCNLLTGQVSVTGYNSQSRQINNHILATRYQEKVQALKTHYGISDDDTQTQNFDEQYVHAVLSGATTPHEGNPWTLPPFLKWTFLLVGFPFYWLGTNLPIPKPQDSDAYAGQLDTDTGKDILNFVRTQTHSDHDQTRINALVTLAFAQEKILHTDSQAKQDRELITQTFVSDEGFRLSLSQAASIATDHGFCPLFVQELISTHAQEESSVHEMAGVAITVSQQEQQRIDDVLARVEAFEQELGLVFERLKEMRERFLATAQYTSTHSSDGNFLGLPVEFHYSYPFTLLETQDDTGFALAVQHYNESQGLINSLKEQFADIHALATNKTSDISDDLPVRIEIPVPTDVPLTVVEGTFRGSSRSIDLCFENDLITALLEWQRELSGITAPLPSTRIMIRTYDAGNMDASSYSTFLRFYRINKPNPEIQPERPHFVYASDDYIYLPAVFDSRSTRADEFINATHIIDVLRAHSPQSDKNQELTPRDQTLFANLVSLRRHNYGNSGLLDHTEFWQLIYKKFPQRTAFIDAWFWLDYGSYGSKNPVEMWHDIHNHQRPLPAAPSSQVIIQHPYITEPFSQAFFLTNFDISIKNINSTYFEHIDNTHMMFLIGNMAYYQRKRDVDRVKSLLMEFNETYFIPSTGHMFVPVHDHNGVTYPIVMRVNTEQELDTPYTTYLVSPVDEEPDEPLDVRIMYSDLLTESLGITPDEVSLISHNMKYTDPDGNSRNVVILSESGIRNRANAYSSALCEAYNNRDQQDQFLPHEKLLARDAASITSRYVDAEGVVDLYDYFLQETLRHETTHAREHEGTTDSGEYHAMLEGLISSDFTHLEFYQIWDEAFSYSKTDTTDQAPERYVLRWNAKIGKYANHNRHGQVAYDMMTTILTEEGFITPGEDLESIYTQDPQRFHDIMHQALETVATRYSANDLKNTAHSLLWYELKTE